MRRTVVVALAAIGLLLAGSVAAIAWLTRGGPELAAPEPPPPAPGADPAPLVPLPAGPIPPGASIAAPAPVAQPLPPPPKGSWAAVPATARIAALGPLGREIRAGLDDLAPRLSRCAEAEVQARHGGQEVSGLQGADEKGAPALMLEIETLDGEVRIVDAPVETRGQADDGLFACAQRALRGQVIPAASARPGSRIRLLYPLP